MTVPSLLITTAPLEELSPPVTYGGALALDNDGARRLKGAGPMAWADLCRPTVGVSPRLATLVLSLRRRCLKGSGGVKRLLRAVPKRKIPEQS